MKKIVKIIPLIILLAIVLVCSVAIYKNAKKQNLNEKLLVSKIVAMPDFSFTDLYDSNKNLSNQDFAGKLSILNVFASWCSTCKAEHQSLLRLAATGSIDIYGIAWNDIDENTMRYLERNGNPYLKIGVDSKGDLTKLLGVKGVPETFIIGKDGKIVRRLQGNLTDDDIEYIERLVYEENQH